MITQTPWAERKFEFNCPVGIFPVVLERLRGTAPRLEAMLENRTEAQLNRKAGDQWSITEQVAHLCEAENVWHRRVEDFLSGQQVLQALGITEDDKVNDKAKPINELLETFSESRNKLLDKVKDMDETTVTLSLIHPRFNKHMKLVDQLFVIAEHDDHHLAKIRELLPL